MDFNPFKIVRDLVGQTGLDVARLPVLGSLFPNEEEAAVRQSLADAEKRLRELQPEVGKSYQNAMQQQLLAYGPAARFAQGMSGGDPAFAYDLAGMGANPATDALMGQPTGQPGGSGQLGGGPSQPSGMELAGLAALNPLTAGPFALAKLFG
jgi:hypothetical protein